MSAKYRSGMSQCSSKTFNVRDAVQECSDEIRDVAVHRTMFRCSSFPEKKLAVFLTSASVFWRYYHDLPSVSGGSLDWIYRLCAVGDAIYRLYRPGGVGIPFIPSIRGL